MVANFIEYNDIGSEYRRILDTITLKPEAKIPVPLKGYEDIKTYPDHSFTFNRNGKTYEIEARNLKLAKKKLDILLKKDAK